MTGILEELHARGMFPAVDQQARDAAVAAAARIDKHEAVCAERYDGIKKANEASTAALLQLGDAIKRRLDDGTQRFARIERAVWGIAGVIVLAALFGDNPFFERMLAIGAKVAAKFAGI